MSALYVKVPAKELTLILLAVTDGLSAEYAWTEEGVHASPYARLLFRHFVFPLTDGGGTQGDRKDAAATPRS